MVPFLSFSVQPYYTDKGECTWQLATQNKLGNKANLKGTLRAQTSTKVNIHSSVICKSAVAKITVSITACSREASISNIFL